MARLYAQESPRGVEEFFMDGFLETAARILDGAKSAVQTGHYEPVWTVLTGGLCGIRMIADTDWPLESLRRENSADCAYRVTVTRQNVAVEGISRSNRCRLESAR